MSLKGPAVHAVLKRKQFIAQIHVSFLLKDKKVRYILQDLKKKSTGMSFDFMV